MSGSGVLESCRSSVRVGTLRKWDLTLPVTGHMAFGRRMRESRVGLSASNNLTKKPLAGVSNSLGSLWFQMWSS